MEPFLWAKVFDFSWTTMAKILSFVVKAALIVGVPVFLFVTVIKPHTNPVPTTSQKGTITNYTYQIKVGLGGCARFYPEVKK